MKIQAMNRAARSLGASFLAIAAGSFAASAAMAVEAQSVTFEGAAFVNKGLVGVGRVPADAKDKLGDTLGGIGSGMVADVKTWKREGDTYSGVFYMLPDRGWNTEGTLDYQGRLQKFSIAFTPNSGADTAPQTQLKLDYQDAILLHEADGRPTTGLDAMEVRKAANGFPDLPSAAGKISVDNEGVVLNADGSFWISDEYGPYIYHYAADGTLLGAIQPPPALVPMRGGAANFASNNPTKGGAEPKPKNPESGRQNNQGLEGLTMSKDGRTLYALLQSSTIQDGGEGGGSPKRYNTRFLAYDIADPKAPKLAAEYVVQLPRFKDAKGKQLVAAQSEILALDDHRFLVIARDSGHGQGLKDADSVYRSIDLFDTSGATNIAGTDFDQAKPVAPGGELDAGVTPVKYARFIDMNDNTQLGRFGLHNGGANDANALYEKWEAMALLPGLDDQAPNDYFLVVASDNDFITQNGAMQGNAYKDSSGANVDSVLLVYRISLPEGMKPL
ncbi:esterase-like activity of phytase family protein [Dongia sp.]|uniref:esterase-like activity of phytase family protein n=1 Tax=Dongia sp. TaxID=1977262 RepID=UPI003751471F